MGKGRIQDFFDERFGSIRTFIDDKGEIWFIAKDIATALGYKKTRNAIRDHVRDKHKKIINLNTALNQGGIAGNPNIVVIKEAGIYSLIFNSKLESAIEFQDWVFEEVLPSIKETGIYVDDSHIKVRYLNKVIRLIETKAIAHFIRYAKSKGYEFDEREVYKELTNITNSISGIDTGKREIAPSINLIMCMISESIIRDTLRSGIKNNYIPEDILDYCKHELYTARYKILECLCDKKPGGKLKYRSIDEALDLYIKISEEKSKIEFNGLTIELREGYEDLWCA